MSRRKSLETALVLTLACIILYLIKSRELFLYIGLAFGMIGVFIKPLASIIAFGWFKLAEILSFVASKLVLGSIFYLLLFPLSVLYRLVKKDPLLIKPGAESTWFKREKTYEKEDMENIW